MRTSQDEEEDNEAMRVGRDLEQYVADRFTEATGRKSDRKKWVFFSNLRSIRSASLKC